MSLAMCLILGSFITLVGPAEGTRPGNQFALVVDLSGSMRQSKITKAIDAVLAISRQSTDDMEVCLYGFADISVKWDKRWRKLPDAAIAKAMDVWLIANKPTSAGTHVILALQHALLAKKKSLTVVIISDGEFINETEEGILAALEAAQKKREKNKFPRAIVITVCVGSKNTTDKMRAIGKAGKGGCYLWKEPKKKKKKTSELYKQ